MIIDINKKEIETIRRLGKCLDSGTILIDETRNLLSGIQQKIDSPADAGGKKRTPAKMGRKDKYRNKLKVI
jgi:hypothetical protein